MDKSLDIQRLDDKVIIEIGVLLKLLILLQQECFRQRYKDGSRMIYFKRTLYGYYPLVEENITSKEQLFMTRDLVIRNARNNESKELKRQNNKKKGLTSFAPSFQEIKIKVSNNEKTFKLSETENAL